MSALPPKADIPRASMSTHPSLRQLLVRWTLPRFARHRLQIG